MTFSRYMPEIVEFARSTQGKAVYCFVVDGNRGTGGCPLVMGLPASATQYRMVNQELVNLLRRSADMLEADIERQAPLNLDEVV